MRLVSILVTVLCYIQTCMAQDDTAYTLIPQTTAVIISADSVLVPASLQYRNPGNIKKLLLGTNYRAEWSTPVRLKIFDINKVHGGLKISELGGGKQTLSATLVDKSGKEWKLRTVDKDPAKVIPENFRSSVAREVVQEMISASHPYAPLAITDLSAAVGVPASNPEFYFVPNDPAFGKYSELFANKVCILEEKDASADNSDTKTTPKVIDNLREENDHAIDQVAVLKARLLDILVGDWDRHFDQWRWGVTDTGKGKVYYPIPRDRDQAFFYSDGLVPRYVSMRRMPFVKGFRYDIPKVNWLGYSARDFDRLFMNSLGKTDWLETIAEFQSNITDSVIENSVKKLPPEIFQLSGNEIAKKLESRNRLLMDEGLKYYAFLSKKVNIPGSDQDEYFKITGRGRDMLLEVFAMEANDPLRLIYSRQFNTGTTKEIRLYGLNGNDRFEVADNVNANIKIRIIGGSGADTFNLKGKTRKYVYDLSTEPNQFIASSKTKKRFSSDTIVNDFNYNEYKYTQMHKFPYITAGFNADDGVLLGVGLQIETYGFRKEPYATSHTLSSLYSFTNKAYQLKYNGTFIDIAGKTDLITNIEFQNPALINFFGLGNNTIKAPGKTMFFYRTRYKYISADVLGRVNIAKNINFSIGPSFYHYWNSPENNANKILENPELVGLDSSGVYSLKTYLGGSSALSFNSTDSSAYPTKGLQWETVMKYLNGINTNSQTFASLQSDMVLYKSLLPGGKLVGVIRVGGGHILSNNFEYFQALNLGANNYLRGFRKNRFSGRSLFYNSIELRYKVVEVKSYILPGTLGVIGFNDIGRVWVQNENSKKLHHAYGGGIFYLPYNLLILAATVGISPEETLFNISLGTKLNLIF